MTLAGIVPSGGEIPRAMNFDTSGDALYVANQRSGNIVKFMINENTGIPDLAGYVLRVKNPVSIQFVALP
jgi:6-phosphogluconolactonase (cycloisomerase 2 family)